MKQPRFFRDFLADQPDDDKQSYKKRLKERGASYKEEKERLTTEQEKAQREVETKQQELKELQRTKSELEEKLQSLSDSLEKMNANVVSKLGNFFKIRSASSEIKFGKIDLENKEVDEGIKEWAIEDLERSIDDLQKKLDENKDAVGEDTRKMVKRYAERQKRKWREAEYSPGEVAELFTTEHLAELSLEEYILLLQRFPSEMVTHVTRQGVRDHVGHGDHTVGFGEFHNAFENMLEDGKLKSILGLAIKEDVTYEEVLRVIDNGTFETEADARAALDRLLNEDMLGRQGSFDDASSIHFAAEEVADAFYGAESGNEIFFAFPSIHIDSQYHYKGNLADDSGGVWNDQWVWANEEEGMDLNAGLVFIPEGANVDPETGSKYLIDTSGKAVENAANMDTIQRLLDTDALNELLTKLSDRSSDEETDGIRAFIADQLQVTDENMQNLLLDRSAVWSLASLQKEDQRSEYWNTVMKEIKRKHVAKHDALYEKPQETVSSQDYWESYFQKHPNKKPSKIVYYAGEDPTHALKRWRQVNGIEKRAQDREFVSLDGDSEEQRAARVKGLDRFRSLAEKVIEHHFAYASEESLAA